jgi:hypothetical protein
MPVPDPVVSGPLTAPPAVSPLVPESPELPAPEAAVVTEPPVATVPDVPPVGVPLDDPHAVEARRRPTMDDAAAAWRSAVVRTGRSFHGRSLRARSVSMHDAPDPSVQTTSEVLGGDAPPSAPT